MSILLRIFVDTALEIRESLLECRLENMGVVDGITIENVIALTSVVDDHCLEFYVET